MGGYDSRPPMKTVRYFTATDVPTPGVEIPTSIRSGQWSEPSKNSIWESFQETRRIGPEWGIYVENYCGCVHSGTVEGIGG